MRKALINVGRIVQGDGAERNEDIATSFLSDLDYTIRSLNEKKPYYYFKRIEPNDPKYFCTDDKIVNVICLDKLPDECTKDHVYEDNKLIYHTNDQEYYIGVYKDGKPSRTYKPSSMKCMRNMYYQVIGADLDKATQTSESCGICESGTDRHERIQEYVTKMKKCGCDCEYIDVETYVNENNLTHLEVQSKENFETKLFDKNRNLIFLCDGIIKYKGKYYILEIKTESSFKWMNRCSVDEWHYYQAYTYALELGIDDVLFLYENRDLCSKKPYLFHVDPDKKQFIVDRLNECDKHVHDKTVPPREESVTSKVCQYCQYRTVCKKDD